MLSTKIQALCVRNVKGYSDLCHCTLVCAAIFHYDREASRPANSSLVNMMKLGSNPMSLLAYAVQERNKICGTFAARRKQAQENYVHILLVNRDCSAVAKEK